MNIKKLFLILFIIFCVAGCKNIKDLSYDEILDNFNIESKSANTFKKGYKFYIPKGLQLEKSGPNYQIISSDKITYYLYLDLISYSKNDGSKYTVSNTSYYNKEFNYNGVNGYIEINLKENNQYLLEIIFNYAKIEVMVDNDMLNKALINSISILNSIKYDSLVIEELINDDNLNYTEEKFDMFENKNHNSNYLDYDTRDDTVNDDNSLIIDTDYVN